MLGIFRINAVSTYGRKHNGAILLLEKKKRKKKVQLSICFTDTNS